MENIYIRGGGVHKLLKKMKLNWEREKKSTTANNNYKMIYNY